MRFLYVFLRPQGKRVWFSIPGCPPFSFTVCSNFTVEIIRGCVSLKKKKSQGKAVEVTVNSKEKTLKIFVWNLSKNSASGRGNKKQQVQYGVFCIGYTLYT